MYKITMKVKEPMSNETMPSASAVRCKAVGMDRQPLLAQGSRSRVPCWVQRRSLAQTQENRKAVEYAN